MSKEVESVVVEEDEFEVWCEDEQRFVINSPSNFYIINALGQKVFYITRDRSAAQAQANLEYDNKYVIRTVKDAKTKSRLESGGLSCYGTATRRGQKKPN